MGKPLHRMIETSECLTCGPVTPVMKWVSRSTGRKKHPICPNSKTITIKSGYGLSEREKRIRQLPAYEGRCEICGDETPFVKIHTDHNHSTGEARGFLCRRCNTGLGSFLDSPEVMRKAIRYLVSRGHTGP